MSTQVSDDVLEDVASKVLLAALASATTAKIDPKKWWVRGRTALVAAAATAESWPHFVSRLGEKLEVESYTGESVRELDSLKGGMDDGPTFRRFRRLVERDSLYIVAMARVMRAAEKAEDAEEEVAEPKADDGQKSLFETESEVAE